MTVPRRVFGALALLVVGGGMAALVDTARAQQQTPNPYPVCNTCDPASTAVSRRVELPQTGEQRDVLSVPPGQRFVLEHVVADLWTGPCANPIGLQLTVSSLPLTALRGWSHSSGANSVFVSERTQIYLDPGKELRAAMMVQRFPGCTRSGPLGAPPSVTVYGRHVPAF